MANKQRISNIREVGFLYKRMEGIDLSVCWYCGAAREHLDHCPPISLAAVMDVDQYRREGGEFFLVPSCAECNITLGSVKLCTPYERLFFMYKKLMDKINRNWVAWPHEEINELRGNLKKFVVIRKKKTEKDVFRFRMIEKRIIENRAQS